MELLESTAFGAALAFGFRHGFDWDHLAALTDLTGSQTRSRRAMALATLYALGHAAMVVALGTLAIVCAARVPDGLDVAMERVVGASLVGLGGWIVWSTARTRGAPPLRSRWMLLIDALRRGVRRVRGTGRPVLIEHSHPHDHHALHEHRHDHLGRRLPRDGRRAVDDGGIAAAATVAAPATRLARAVPARHAGREGVHAHVHRHLVASVDDPFVTYGAWSSFGVGLLHGVGAETPTQVLVLATAAHATSTASSLGVLVCFVAGLVAANTLVAAASTFGFRTVLRRPAVLVGLAAVTAAFSLTVGLLLLAGKSAVLPPILA